MLLFVNTKWKKKIEWKKNIPQLRQCFSNLIWFMTFAPKHKTQGQNEIFASRSRLYTHGVRYSPSCQCCQAEPNSEPDMSSWYLFLFASFLSGGHMTATCWRHPKAEQTQRLQRCFLPIQKSTGNSKSKGKGRGKGKGKGRDMYRYMSRVYLLVSYWTLTRLQIY